MKSFPTVQRLHPFEQAMLELTWGTQTYEKVLSKVDSLRKSILQASFLHLGEGGGEGGVLDVTRLGPVCFVSALPTQCQRVKTCLILRVSS